MGQRRHLRAVGDADDRTDLLMERVSRGDRDAFAELFDQLAPMVNGVCRRVLRDGSLAEEVTQEVLLEVWRSAPRHRHEVARARTWVATIAHRRAVDRVRSEQSERDRRQQDAAARVPAAPDPVAEAAVAQHDRDEVNTALASLTTIQREAVELAYFGGHTHTEVAALLDLPVGTVKTRIRDGLIRLRDSLRSNDDPAATGRTT